VVHVDIIQAIFPCLLRVDVVDLSPDHELIACGVWMRFSLSFIFNFAAARRGEFSEVDGNYILGVPSK